MLRNDERLPVPRRRRRFALPPWVAPALMLGVLVPVALSQEARRAATQPVTSLPRAAATPPPAVPERTLFDWYLAGGIFMHPIALCSVVALAIVVERLASLRRGATAPRAFLPGLTAVMHDLRADRDAGLSFCLEHDHALSRVIAAGLRRSPRGVEAMEKAMEDQGAAETVRLRRNMRVLYAIASIATLLGLIGTIQGMIYAFQEAEVVGTGKFAPLARGIYVALVTTFAGLLVAIPVTMAYYFLAGRIERVVTRLNDEAGAFLDHYTSAPPAAR